MRRGKNSNDSKSAKYNRIITVGFDEFAPMGFTENGEVVGFDVDLAKEAAKRMGVTFEFKLIDWSNKEKELDSGNVDMIWNGLSMLDERKEHVTFSKPYMDNRQIILVAKDNPKEIHSVGDLTGKIVAAQAGSTAETYIDEDEHLRNSFAKFKTYRNINEGFEALSKGEVDALITDEIAARYYINKNHDKFEIVEATIGSVSQFAIGFRKGNTELRDKVQTAFDSMVKDGTAKEISEKWFGADLIKLSM